MAWGRRGKSVVTILLCACSMAITATSVRTDDSSVPERELLLIQDIPVVVITAAKVEQPILESPSTITVLTKEDIRRYGITSFSDIMRNVPGVDVMSVSPTDRNISMRGFNQLVAGRILSLVDNRPIYLDFYGMTQWELLPVSMDEIERIEIVRGPGSALYGANAFDGVVNIITDSLLKSLGTRMTAEVDHSSRLAGSLVHSDRKENLSYKTSLGWDRISGWDDDDSRAGENRRFNGNLKYSMYDGSSLNFSGGISDYQGDFLLPAEFDPMEYNGTTNYVQTRYARSNVEFRALWNRIVWNVEPQEAFPENRIENDLFDANLQHSFRPLDNNFITWGLNYRFNWLDSELLAGRHSQNLLAGYIQDQLRLAEGLALTAGVRYDRHPLAGSNFSPRGSLVYSPAAGHALRVSAGSAFQNPPLLYSYFSTGYSVPMPMSPEPMTMKLLGNEDLSPEWITSLELGYKGNFGSRLRGGLDLFHNQLDGLMEFKATETYDENALFPGSPGGVIPAEISIFNERDAEAKGGELSAEFDVNQWLSFYGNYSYQHVTDAETVLR